MRPYLLQLAFVLTGLVLVISVSLLFHDTRVLTIATLLVFIIGYLALMYFLKISPAIKIFWRLDKIYFLFIGIVAGILIQGIPFFITNHAAFGRETFLEMFSQVTLSGLFFTFLIVLWEELWFRNPILNLAETKKQQILLSIYIGLLFATIHLLNIKVNLNIEGPELMLAGTLLTISYYASRSIWLPIGLHFGNNIFSSMLEKSNLVASGTDTGIKNELVLRWVILTIAIGIVFLYWLDKKKTAV